MDLTTFYSQVLNSQHKLYRFALRMLGSVQEAEDVVQEVFLSVWDKGSQVATIQNPEAWCMRAVKNRSIDQLRRRQKIDHAGMDGVDAPAQAMGPDQQTEISDQMQQLTALLNGLPEKQKMIVQLREIEGYSYQEISEMLHLPLNQVKVNLFRARQSLRTGLQNLDAYHGTTKSHT